MLSRCGRVKGKFIGFWIVVSYKNKMALNKSYTCLLYSYKKKPCDIHCKSTNFESVDVVA